MSNIALIIAGGSGNRMGQDIPKQFMHIDGAPVIIHTMKAFEQHPDIDGIAVVCLHGWDTVLQSYANQFNITKLKWIFPGGKSGMESIHNGIYGLKEAGCSNEDLVLIHDAVRPLLSQEIISSNIAICKAYGYAITGFTLGVSTPCPLHLYQTKRQAYLSRRGIRRDLWLSSSCISPFSLESTSCRGSSWTSQVTDTNTSVQEQQSCSN